MNKIFLNILKIIILLIIIQLIISPISEAYTIGNLIEAGDNFIKEGQEKSKDIIENDKLHGEISNIYNILFYIAIILSVIIGGVLGIQLMWGSIEKQAKAKEMMLPYIAGCVVCFGAFGIWKLVVTILGSI